eukprot:TRINITY_DN36974_c0_g1_i1.p3 TRINITY_DN36974_c0_g1~~TRINITY_DN36974_c0_g1_i1.p3  ORF type:complete len:106 (+),score=3.62 TRINITY_DN36974_c0_g1_i1:38-355(+)
MCVTCGFVIFFFFQAEDGIRDHAQSRGLGDVYKRQCQIFLYISMLSFLLQLYSLPCPFYCFLVTPLSVLCSLCILTVLFTELRFFSYSLLFFSSLLLPLSPCTLR